VGRRRITYGEEGDVGDFPEPRRKRYRRGGRRKKTTDDYLSEIAVDPEREAFEQQMFGLGGLGPTTPPAIESALEQALSGEPVLQESLTGGKAGAAPRRDTSTDWYQPWYATDEMIAKARPELEPDEPTAADKAEWMPQIKDEFIPLYGKLRTVTLPDGTKKEFQKHELHKEEAIKWDKKKDESWQEYKQRMLYLVKSPGMTSFVPTVIRTDPDRYGDVVTALEDLEPIITSDRPGHQRVIPRKSEGVEAANLSGEELKAYGMQRVMEAPTFGQDPLDWTGRLLMGTVATKPAFVGRVMAKFGNYVGSEILQEAGKDLQSIFPQEGGSLPVVFNIVTRIPDVVDALTSYTPPDAFKPGQRLDWGSVVHYAQERAHIKGSEYRMLHSDEMGHYEELEGRSVWGYYNPWGEPMAQSTKDNSKFNPITPLFESKFWENTGEEFKGLIMIIPMSLSAIGYLGGRDPIEERLAEIGKFGADISGHIGHHLGMIPQLRYGDYVEHGLVSAVADPLIVLAPLKGFMAGRAAANLDRAGLMRVTEMGQEAAAAHGERISTMITKLETRVAEGHSRVQALREGRRAGKTLPKYEVTKAEINEIAERTVRAQAQLQRMKAYHAHYESMLEQGALPKRWIDPEAADLFVPGEKIVRGQRYKYGELYRDPLSVIDDLSAEIASADAQVLRAETWLRKHDPKWRAQPELTMTESQLGKWIKLDGSPKAAFVAKIDDIAKTFAELEELKAAAADTRAGKVTSTAIQKLEQRIATKFEAIPDEVAWRYRERIRRVLEERGNAAALSVFEQKLSGLYGRVSPKQAPGFAAAEGPRVLLGEAGETAALPQMAAGITADWLPGGARAQIPKFVVKEAFPAPWEMGLREFTVEWNRLRSAVKTARSNLSRRLREQFDRGEITTRDLRRRGWSEAEISQYERLRDMAGTHNPFAAPQPRFVLRDLQRLQQKGLAGAEEAATLAADANLKALGAGKGAAGRAAAELNLWAEELAAAGKTPKVALKEAKARAAELRTTQAKFFESVETEATAARRAGMSAEVVEVMDRAAMWHKVERFIGHVMRYADPFTAVTQAWRYRNHWIDNYGLSEGATRFTPGQLLKSEQAEKLHEFTMAQRYWTRNRNNANLAARRALGRAAESEVTQFQFRSQEYLREISEYDIYGVVAGDTLDTIAARYATTLKPAWRVKQEIIRDNRLDLIRRKNSGESVGPAMDAALERIPVEWETAKGAVGEIERLIDAHGVYFWEHVPEAVLFQKQDILRMIMDSASIPGSQLNLRLMRHPLLQGLERNQKLELVIRNTSGANELMATTIRNIQTRVRDIRVDPKTLVLEPGEVLRIRDTDLTRMKARQRTVFEAIHYEHADVLANVYRDAHAPAGMRFSVREGAPNAAEYEAWVRIANRYDTAIDLSKELTLQSIQVDLLSATDNLYEIWASNWYSREGRKGALERRLTKKIEDRKALEGYEEMTKREKKRFDKENDTWLAEQLQKFDAVETNVMGHQTFEGLKGAAERKRRLGDPESGISIQERINEYGMSGELQDLILEGMMQQKRDIATARMWRKMSEDNSMFSRTQKMGWYEVNNSSLPGTGLKKFGKELPDKFYLHPDVYWDFKGMSYMQKHQGHALVKALSYWKAFKTALNPAVHATNILSNVLLLGPMHGLSPWDPRAVKAMSMATKEFVLGRRSVHYQAWINNGGSPAGALNRIEMVTDAQRAFGNMMFGAIGRGKEGVRIAGEMLTSTLKREWRGAGRAFKQLNYDLPGLAYSAGDDFFRFSLFLLKTGRYMGKGRRAALIKQGKVRFVSQAWEGEAKIGTMTGRTGKGTYQFLDDAYAAQLGRRAFARYEEMAGFMRYVSTSVIGKPFLAFDTTTIPMFAEWLRAKPLQARMWQQMYESMTDINFRKSHMTDERAKKQKENLPDWSEDKMMMLRQIAPELAESDTGAENWFNVLKYGIGGRLLRHKGESMLQWTQRVMGSEHPLYSILLYNFVGEHPYFHTKLDADHPHRGRVLRSHFFQTILPSYAFGGYAWQRIEDSGFRFFSPNEFGRPRYGRGVDEKPWQAFLAVLGGVNIQEFDPILRSEQQQVETQKAGGGFSGGGPLNQIKALKKRYASGKERYATTPTELRTAIRDLYNIEYQRAREEGARVQPVSEDQLDREVAQTEALKHHTMQDLIKRVGARVQVYKTLGRNTAIDIQHKQAELDKSNRKRKEIIALAVTAAHGADDWSAYKDVFTFIEDNTPQLGDEWASASRVVNYQSIINTMLKRNEFRRAAVLVRQLEHMGDDALDSMMEMDADYNVSTWYDEQIKRIARSRRKYIGKLKRGE